MKNLRKQGSKLANFIRQYDKFGYPVSLAYEGNKMIKKTLLGGIISLILGLILLEAAYVAAHKIIQSEYTTSSSS